MPQDPKTLGDIVEEITQAGDDEETIAVRDIMESVGQRSFGPLLLVPGLVLLSPLSGMPGVPTLGAVVVLLIAGQMLLGREYFWVPQFIMRRTVRRQRMSKAGRVLAPVARVVDMLVKPRLVALTRPPVNYLMAVACMLIALMMPPFEAIPFANVVTAAGITAFGLALIAHDGVLVVLAFTLTAVSFYFLLTGFVL